MSSQNHDAFEVRWRIENAEPWFETRNDTLYSLQFLVKTLMNTRWKLALTPNWQFEEKYISLILQKDVDDHSEPIYLSYELLFITKDGSTLKSKTCQGKFDPKTGSQELSVKQVEILVTKSKSYLPEGVLTVSCKLWQEPAVSTKRKCSIQTVIGKKDVFSCATIDRLKPPSVVTVNFVSPSRDISLISLDIYVDSEELIFERKHVECKSFGWYICKLFAIGPNGENIRFKEKNDIAKLPIFNDAHTYECMPSYNSFLNNPLFLRLWITYYPAVISEGKSYSEEENFWIFRWTTTKDENSD